MTSSLSFPKSLYLQISLDPQGSSVRTIKPSPAVTLSATEQKPVISKITGNITPEYWWKCTTCSALILITTSQERELNLCPLFHHLIRKHQQPLECTSSQTQVHRPAKAKKPSKSVRFPKGLSKPVSVPSQSAASNPRTTSGPFTSTGSLRSTLGGGNKSKPDQLLYQHPHSTSRRPSTPQQVGKEGQYFPAGATLPYHLYKAFKKPGQKKVKELHQLFEDKTLKVTKSLPGGGILVTTQKPINQESHLPGGDQQDQPSGTE
jgi:hypothetical protein